MAMVITWNSNKKKIPKMGVSKTPNQIQSRELTGTHKSGHDQPRARRLLLFNINT
jgi:hypothetical protein